MEPSLTLSRNAIAEICLPDGNYNYSGEAKILQITEFKDFSSDPTKKKIRIRMKLSDGFSHTTALVPTATYSLMMDTELKIWDVIELRGFKKQDLKGKQILMITEPFALLKSGLDGEIGTPVDFAINQSNGKLTSVPQLKVPTKSKPVPSGRVTAPVQTMALSGTQDITPISALNTFNNDWTIKCRVTKVCPPFNWKNARGEGTLMNIELIDAKGDQIQCTMFGATVERYKTFLEEGKCYTFKRGTIKAANKRYTSIKNDYSITFNKDTII